MTKYPITHDNYILAAPKRRDSWAANFVDKVYHEKEEIKKIEDLLLRLDALKNISPNFQVEEQITSLQKRLNELNLKYLPLKNPKTSEDNSINLIKKAMNYAFEKHKPQKRKGSEIPYFVHLMDVASILMKDRVSENLVAAGFLHDVVEDNKYTGVTEEDLKKEFPEEVIVLVKGETEIKKDSQGNELPWKTRKHEAINRLRASSTDIKKVKCADALANVNDILRDYANEGRSFLDKFKKTDEEITPQDRIWYYQSILDAIPELKGLRMYGEYQHAVDLLKEIKLTDAGKIARL